LVVGGNPARVHLVPPAGPRPKWADREGWEMNAVHVGAWNSYSLVEMQRGAIANNLAFIEYYLAMINADHGPELVIEELLPAVFDVFRESDPVADSQRDLLSLEQTEFSCLVER
jgi:hypothetical protein